MKAFQFLDIQFQHKAIEISKMRSDNYDVKVGGEAQALRMLLEFLRVFYKWYAIPKIIVQFLAVNVGLKAAPISPLIPQEVKKEVEKTKLALANVLPEGTRPDESTPGTLT